MKQKSKSSDTWISLAERPPPATVTTPRLLLRFLLAHDGEAVMGYYLGDRKVRILGEPIGPQQALTLDHVTHWQAVNPRQLQEIENAEEIESGSMAEAPTCERDADRGNAEAGSGRDSEPAQDGRAAFEGFEDLEDAAEWADIEQETPSRFDPGVEFGDLQPGEQ